LARGQAGGRHRPQQKTHVTRGPMGGNRKALRQKQENPPYRPDQKTGAGRPVCGPCSGRAIGPRRRPGGRRARARCVPRDKGAGAPSCCRPPRSGSGRQRWPRGAPGAPALVPPGRRPRVLSTAAFGPLGRSRYGGPWFSPARCVWARQRSPGAEQTREPVAPPRPGGERGSWGPVGGLAIARVGKFSEPVDTKRAYKLHYAYTHGDNGRP